jgi:hypothetical protein
MSGLKSRRKGMRGEYLVRDAIRKAGFVVDRVPASGASQGFKGDLRIRYNNEDILVEVKYRKEAFANIYKLFGGEDLDSILVDTDLIITKDPGCAVYGTVKERHGYYFTKFNSRLFAILKGLFRLRGNCDILAIKSNGKPTVYLRWTNEEAYVDAATGTC